MNRLDLVRKPTSPKTEPIGIYIVKRVKRIKSIKSILLSPFMIGLVMTLGFTYVAVDYYAHVDEAVSNQHDLRGLIRQIHDKTIDWRLASRGPVHGSDRIAILAVDDESVRLEGRWPWPRDKMAKLIDRVFVKYKAKLMTFDMNFSEPDNSSALPTLTRLTDAAKAGSDANLKQLLDSELAKADVDAVLANSIDASRDQIILGSFPLEDGHYRAYQDICSDAHFQRTYAGRYWSTELIKPAVIDQPLNTLQYPKAEVAANLKDYFGNLETLEAGSWLANAPDAIPRIAAAFKVAGFEIDEGLIPYLVAYSINNDYFSAQQLFSDRPAYANNAAIRSMFGYLSRALTEKEIATLRSTLFNVGLDYCHRFFTDDDELRTVDLFKKRHAQLDAEQAQALFDSNSWNAVWAQAKEHHPDQNETSEQAIARLKTTLPPILIPEKARWEVNIPAIDAAKSHTGSFEAVLDGDGSIRKNALLRRDGFTYVPSIAFKTFLVDQKLSAQATVDTENVGRENSNGRVFKSLEVLNTDGDTLMTIPVNKQGLLQINYSGPSYMFPYVSATDLLSDSPTMKISERVFVPSTGRWEVNDHTSDGQEVDKERFLKDKILILGATAIGINDMRVTPFEENYAGVETHANALSNLLVEAARAKGEKVAADAPGFLRTSPLEETTMWICLLVGGLVLSALLTYFGSVAGLGITALFLAVIYAVDKYYLFKSGIVVVTLFPISLVIADFVALTSFKYFTEERKKRELKGTFAKYVSPAIVDEVLADPENIELGGKKMDLTVMFSDVRGFTTISEKLDPRALSDLLNSYLTPMTNLVFKHKGTLDKYMGDAIMAFWGAPVHFPDHAQHACRCALAMLVKLRELQAEYRAKGLPEIDIGIGLNTGEMSVGNMGSDTVRSYTVMGDAVNLGSRLEGINKQYGTRIIISEFTQAAVKDTFVCREVDWVKVKGKAQPVRIFELVAEGTVEPSKSELLRLFAEGFALYHDKKFDEAIGVFTEALAIDPNDAPSQLYVERCQDYVKDPPPADWDGVFTMTSK